MSSDHCRNQRCDQPRGTWRQGSRSGYCPRCAKRWAYNGYPAGGPPEPRTSTAPKRDLASRVEDYRFLKARGLSRAEAALRLGISKRTIERYETRLRAGAA